MACGVWARWGALRTAEAAARGVCRWLATACFVGKGKSVPSLRRDAGRLDPSAQYASGLDRRTRRGSPRRTDGPSAARTGRRGALGTSERVSWEGVLCWEGAHRGTEVEASRTRRGTAGARERGRRRVKFLCWPSSV
jgi:hypothetical protein